MTSLQDQLLKAGVVDDRKARQLKKEKRKESKSIPKGQSPVNETREQVIKRQAEQAARDREISRQQQEAAEAKAINAQIKQLIETHRINYKGGDTAYHFSDGKKIKTIYVSPQLVDQLSKGLIAIVKLNEHYELVPRVVAEKIQQRNKDIVILQIQPGKQEVDADDPYADYKIPDDLMW